MSMTEYKLFAQRVGLVGITNLIVNLRGLILIPILTKTLGADAYGVWSVIMVTISLLSPLALLGTGLNDLFWLNILPFTHTG